jgi:hypothetical protein
LEARGVPNSGVVNLTYEGLLPLRPSTIALSPAISPLITFYKNALPANHVTSFGPRPHEVSIKAEFDASNVETWKTYGWTAERRCSDRVLTGIRLPVFFITNDLGWAEPCPGQREIILKGKWMRGPTELFLITYRGTPVKIETSQGLKIASTPEDQSPKQFTLHPNELVTISIESIHGALTWLREGKEDLAALPPLESFQPVPQVKP